ncbi:helix-turn-helix domain-containing protein [Flavobacterium laiguense]|uniref:Transcriptional regulator n=1 Tax=Flavobacterium laiguense TaxID=2169409 RepID=A0A2U1JXG5_9FLAO|nr:transcriptional regulator [Flavobacterium laiguense]
MEDIDDIICDYIYTNWVKPHKSQRSFGLDHNIDESTVRKIKEKNYNIPVKTLHKICEARNIKLSEFFKLIDK